ncbi:hypothetical protein [Candidatus Magnetominusculus dajiuhuensis]|uniref:hypothetical protein n=1 Tax=Candidatus Magnetominusculus dajiuhuensis TaxID=3137712 RepID=UPI003B4328D4
MQHRYTHRYLNSFTNHHELSSFAEIAGSIAKLDEHIRLLLLGQSPPVKVFNSVQKKGQRH